MEAAFVPALERIERQIGEGFDAAQRDRDAKHAEDAADHADTHRMLRELLASERKIPPENLRPLFEAVGREVPEAQFEEAVRTAVAELLARAERKPQVFNDPVEIQAAIEAARAKLRLLDPDGAVAILDGAEAEEEANVAARNRGRARMRTEKAEILKTVYRYDDALEAFAEAAALDPADPWPHFESGDIWQIRGNVTRALACYETGRDVAVEVGNERDLSVSHNRIGDVMVAQGRLEDAAQSFQAGLEIAERLARSDPSNAGLQRDLSVSHSRIGNVRVAQDRLEDAIQSYEAMQKILAHIAISDASNAGLQRDLSVSHDKIGDVRIAQGRLEDAAQSFQAGLEIAERIAKSDPSHAGLQRDLLVIHSKIGDVRIAQGRLEDAAQTFQAGLEIFERLAKSDPSHAGLQRDLIISNVKLAEIDADPVGRYGQALAIARTLAATGRLAPADHWMVPELERLLREAGC
ncbi:tetratricopeptide repeat protein [Jiella endophytica]|uniref:Tetratricopeptide repeat protein n=1 Tax=Jiella endophytica TaxID=2558362 RepID=A0A4Y8RHJ9_9HYPH|nr:tetratricopeptide repeat protein [Jiella endophytica]TFF21725.1 tetratricopeptide repeat protein [Jiella endophytica]